MNIVVLLKAVPVVGTERLGGDLLTDRSVQLEANGNDEYLLEKALKLTETHGGEVSLLTVGPAGATEPLRKALAMGAAKAVHVADDAIRGSDMRATLAILAAALAKMEFDLVFAGADTSDGQGGVLGAALASRLGLPYLSYASEIEPLPDGGVRIQRISAAGYDVLESPTPAVVMGTQLLGAPRYPALRGIMQARSKPIETWTLAELGLDPGSVGEAAATTRTLGSDKPAERAGATFVREPADVAVAQIVDFLAARRLV
ncbi:MAG TPA: electron transfer flavoprotein subunit beta/FixA family protein [Candidatus Limnocylindrales bacterium]|nr:electron transfer flavoprotein subunit beta/FixA family protein [Candidatus Limnocylindrales bacterium]